LQQPAQKIFDNTVTAVSNVQKIFSNEESELLHKEIEGLKNKEEHLSLRLERIIYSLESQVNGEFHKESLSHSIEELKQIKNLLHNAEKKAEK